MEQNWLSSKTIITKIESDVMNVPHELKEILGHDTKIIVGAAALIAFSAITSFEDALRNVELIWDDIQFRKAEEKLKPTKTMKKMRGKPHRRADSYTAKACLTTTV